MELTGVDASAYERVSKDDSGRERSPEEQHDGHLVTCEKFGWRLQQPTYREVGSASKHQRKVRKQFDRLIADLESGRFTARVLMLYSSSRGSRKTEEWLQLINLCDRRGVVFWVDQHERTYDPRKPRDRKQLIDDASKSELEVAEMSQNIRRTTAASARRGLPHGRIPFGYRRLYDERTKKLIAQEPHPVESKVVKAMYRRVLRGHTLVSIARHFNEKGIKRRDGGDWVPQNIALMLLRECYMGVRVHDPARGSAYKPLTVDAVVTKGTWEPLVSKATYLGVKRILRDPTRKTVEHPGAVLHLLSGIAACAKCGELLRVNRKGRRGKKLWRYVCITNGCVAIDKAELEEYAEKSIVAYLTTLTSELVTDEDASDELAKVQDELAEAREELAELERQMRARDAAGKKKMRFAGPAAADLEDRIDELEEREKELETPSALAGLIKVGPTVPEQWKDAEFSTHRALAKIVLAPTPAGRLGLGQLQVLPIGPGRRKVPITALERTKFHRPNESPARN